MKNLIILIFLALVSCGDIVSNNGNYENPNWEVATNISTENTIYNSTIVEDKIYCADGTGGIKFLDFEFITSPSLFYQIETLDKTYDLCSKDDRYLFSASGESGVYVIDLMGSFHPEIIYNILTENAVSVVSKDNTVFVSNRNHGISIYNVENPDTPFPISENFYSGSNIGKLFVKEDYLFAINDKEVLVFDISNVDNIFLKESLFFFDNIYDIEFQEDNIFLLSENYLHLYRKNSSNELEKIKDLYFIDTLKNFKIIDDYFYLGYQNDTIEVYDYLNFVDSEFPVSLDDFNGNFDIKSLDKFGDYLVISNGTFGLKLIKYIPQI